MGRLILEKEELRLHLKEVAKKMPEHKLGAYYTNVCIQKYSPEDQQASFDEVCRTILEVPGGYWQIVDNMDYMPEFEHTRMRRMLSYQKGYVPKTIAKKELTVKQYRNIYK